MNNTVNFEHGGNIYKALRQSGAGQDGFLDFSANINPLGLAGNVREAVIRSLEDVIHYPDAEAHDLKLAIADFYRVNYDTITVGNGAVELIYVLCHMLKPERVLIPVPAFSEYERAAAAAGAKVDYYFLAEANGFELRPDGIIPMLKGIDIVFIGNPNNPTGTLLTRPELEELIEAANRVGCLVVIDESFIEFLPDDGEHTCRPLLKRYANLVIIHSLTKFYAIPGLRLGFALTPPELANRLNAGKDPWNVNTLAQAAGVAAFQNAEYRSKTKAVVHQARQELFSSLATIDKIKPYQPTVNFVLIRLIAARITAGQLQRRLFARRILVRDCSNYPGLSPGYLRLAVKLPEQNLRLINALQEFLTGGDR